MTIREAYSLINNCEVEPKYVGLADNPAFSFSHEGSRYMLSECKGQRIALWDLTRSPHKIIDQINLSEGTNDG